MDKLEKVIKGLECCLKDDCDNCPYYDPEVDHDCDYFGKCLRGNMYHDALALLKAQEPIAPVKVNRYMETDENGNWFSSETYDCGNCGVELHDKANYCHLCGRAVKWK